MIKYTVLYKNGKTWNGKAETIHQIKAFDCLLLITQPLPGKFKIYSPFQNRSWSWVEDRTFFKNPARKPNPASKTKKQKAFDKAYAEWKINNSNLVDYDDGSGYMKYAHVGNGDTSIKAYKKWLWEQKQAELKSVLKETSLDEFVRVDVPDGFSTSDGWIPWHGGECPVPGDAKVEVKYRNGVASVLNTPKKYWWGRDGEYYGVEIIAYRLLDEENKPAKVIIQLPGQIAPSALPIPLTYDKPIKTTYTFWLGAFGEISDEL